MSLLSKILEIILYTTLHKAMGLNFSRVRVESYLGIREMKEVLRAFRLVLLLLESSTTSKISYLTTFQ